MYAQMKQMGGAMCFQTATLSRIGNLATTIQEAINMGANSLEIPSGTLPITMAQLNTYTQDLAQNWPVCAAVSSSDSLDDLASPSGGGGSGGGGSAGSAALPIWAIVMIAVGGVVAVVAVAGLIAALLYLRRRHLTNLNSVAYSRM